MNILTNINLNKNELQNAVMHPLAMAPANPVLGQIYYDSVNKLIKVFDGTNWTAAGAVTSVNSQTGDVTITATSIGLGNVDNTSDATKKSNFTGSIADGNTGFVTGDAAYDALALKANLASPAFSGTPTAPTASAGTNTTQVATTAFVMSAIGAVGDAMVFKGTIGTGGTVTSLPNTHEVGWTYKVITAATYAGKVCEIGDMIICVADGTTASNDDWTVVQNNIDGAVTGPANSTSGHIPTFNGTSGKVLQDGYGVASSISNDSTSIPLTSAVYAALGGLVKSATGSINTSSTSADVSFTGTLIDAYATMSDDFVELDKKIGTNKVTFSTAQNPTSTVTCTVVYI